MLIAIHRVAFQQLIARRDADTAASPSAESPPSDGDLASPESIASRALRKIRLTRGGMASSQAEPSSSHFSRRLSRHFSASRMSRTDSTHSPGDTTPQTLLAQLELLEKGVRVFHKGHGTGRITEIDPTSTRGTPYRVLFDNGEMHSYSAASAAKLKVVALSELLERAMTAQLTMKSWCDLRGMAPMAFVTMTLPEQLQEFQVRAHYHASAIDWARYPFAFSSGASSVWIVESTVLARHFGFCRSDLWSARSTR